MKSLRNKILPVLLTILVFVSAYASGPSLVLKSSFNSALYRPTRIAANKNGSIAIVEYHRKQINVFNETHRLINSISIPQAPLSVAFSADNNLLVGVENDILKMNMNGEIVDKFSLHGFTPSFPADIAVDANGSVYVVDRDACNISVCSATGEKKFSFGTNGSLQGEFRSPIGIAIDESSGELIIADAGNSRIQIFSIAGEFNRMFGHHVIQVDTSWQVVGAFARIQGVAVDAQHRIYATDSGLEHVQMFDGSGNHIGFVGKDGLRDSRLRVPMGIVISQSNKLLIASMGGSDVKEYEIQTLTIVSPITSELPTRFALEQNFPNPFNPTTQIKFSLPEPGWVTLKIYDVVGREVIVLANEDYRTGIHTIEWNGRNNTDAPVASGIYFYHLQVGDKYSQTNKMVFLK